jgi:hypothetical protein
MDTVIIYIFDWDVNLVSRNSASGKAIADLKARNQPFDSFDSFDKLRTGSSEQVGSPQLSAGQEFRIQFCSL